jgi:hypothetical protein
MSLRPLVIAALVLGVLSLSVTAQDAGQAGSHVRNGWHPRLKQVNAPSAADLAIIERNLTAAELLMTRTSGYATPAGFEARARWVSSPPSAPGRLRSYWVEIDPYVPTREAAAGGYIASAWIVFNPDFGRVSEGSLTSETGEIYYNERTRSERRYGATAVYGAFGEFNNALQVLFTAGDEDPMWPVTREEFLRAQIHVVEKEAAGLEEAQQAATMTPYQRWLAEAPQRKQGREQAVAAMPDNAAAEKLRAELERTEREVTEELKKREAQDAESLRAFRKADPSAGLREQLAAMSAEERASPAWAGGTQLMPANAPNALRIVRVDPSFLRARGPAAAPRAILVRMREPSRGLEVAQNQLYREFDWAALKKMLDTRP